MNELVCIMILEWMLLGLVGLVNVDMEVLSDVLDVVKLNWLPPFLTWLIILVIVLDIVHHVLILIEREVLLIAFEVTSLCSKVWIGKRFLL